MVPTQADTTAWTVVTVTGALDRHTAAHWRQRLRELTSAGQSRLVVDIDAVTFLDATGLGVLVGAQRRSAAADGDLRVVATRETVVRVLRVTGLDRTLGRYDSVEAAAALHAPQAKSA
jgi:anti-sigma B factor antagonist